MIKRLLFLLILVFFTSLNAQWQQTNGPYGGYVYCFGVSGTNIFTGIYGGVFLSTNNGGNWTAVNNGLTSSYVYAITVSGTNIFAGTFGGGVFLSTDNGGNWTAVNNGLTSSYVYTLTVSGTNIFAGTDGGVFLSTNNGGNWTAVNTGLPYSTVKTLTISGTNIFAGTNDGGVWMRPLSEMVSGGEDGKNEKTVSFVLEQNYPNPFNPTTTIKYSVGSQQFVSLKVFDVLGNEVSTLVSEEKSAGNYSVDFNASHLSSGVYFYSLKSGGFDETRKLVVVK